MYPLVMFQLAVAHPRGLWLWKPGRKPGVMITANQIHATGVLSSSSKHSAGNGPEAYCIACVKNRVAHPLAELLSRHT